MNSFDFQNPLYTFLLLLLPLIFYLRNKTRKRLPFTYAGPALSHCQPLFFKKHYDSILYILIFICLVFALINIGFSEKTVKEFIESKWIMLALDVSGSMKRTANTQKDTSLEDVAIYGAEKFISMRSKHDLLGLIAFSSTAKLLAPLTFDKNLLRSKLELLEQKSSLYREMTAGGGTNAPAAIWRSLTVFFSMLPEGHKLSVSEIAMLRNYLSGQTESLISIPPKLENIGFGKGMSIILLTDGRIAPSKRVHAQHIPNFFNTLKLMDKLNVKLYIISIGEEVDPKIVEAIQDSDIGRLFITSKDLDKEAMEKLYQEINKLESNRILSRLTITKTWLRTWFIITAIVLFLTYSFLRLIPGYQKN